VHDSEHPQSDSVGGKNSLNKLKLLKQRLQSDLLSSHSLHPGKKFSSSG
jgi:hypothetical protein